MKKISRSLFIFFIFLTSCQPPISEHYNPKASAYNVQLGVAYLKQGNWQRAKQKLLMALVENPDSGSANAALAYYFETIHEEQLANQYYQRALQLEPHSGAVLNNYGAFLCCQKRYKEANHYFLKAISEPQYLNTALAYENAGLCARRAGDVKKAKYYFTKALAQDFSLKQSLWELERIQRE